MADILQLSEERFRSLDVGRSSKVTSGRKLFVMSLEVWDTQPWTGAFVAERQILVWASEWRRYALGRMAEADDTELLRVAREGDATAFDALIRRHDRFLYRVARSILLDDYEAEDVVQETFIKAFKRLVDFRGEASLSTWLTRIALNEALARKRRQRTTVELEALKQPATQIEPSPMIAPAQDPEVTAAQHQIRRLLERAIDGLPDSLRTVFVMRDVEELSTAEAARLLGLGEPTVKTRLHRARRMLRQILGDQVATSLNDVFPFERQRCDLLVERVLRQVGLRK